MNPEPVMLPYLVSSAIFAGAKRLSAKWNDVMGADHIERLRHIRDLITKAGRYDTTATRLFCFSGAGFNDRARDLAGADVYLIDLNTLCG